MSQPVLIAFFLTSFAGISTGIGSAIAFFAKRTNTSFLSLSLGFSTAVMIYMSFANLFASSLQTLANIHGKDDGTLHSTLSFFGGIVLILLIDKLIPHYENPHEMHRVEEMSLKEERKTEIKPQLLRVDVVTGRKNFIFTKNDYLCPCRQRFTDKTHVKRLTLCSTYRLLRMPQSDGKYSYSQKSAQRAAYSEG